jgi:transcriptional regulator of arginine metabolism
MNMQTFGAAAGSESGGARPGPRRAQRGRPQRLARLRQLVAGREAHSQGELQHLLEQEGFEVTQATLSRDLKHLRVGKLPDGRGGYRYVLPETGAAGSESSLIEDFRRGFLTIEFSGNQGVIKTLPGHANSVAFALDNLRVRDVLGTIAGDDTILVIPRDGVRRSTLAAALRARIPGLREGGA